MASASASPVSSSGPNAASSRRRRYAALFATMAVAVVTLSACAGSPASSAVSTTKPAASASSAGAKTLKIGFSPFTLQVAGLKGLADGLTAVGKSQGDTVITADPKGSPTTQLQQLQQWVQLGQVDAIWVIPVAAKTITPVLKQAQQKGIVVIASGVPADYGLTAGEPGITFTNVDNKAFGGKLGEQAAKCITDRLSGKGKVIFLKSAAGQQSTADINNNFLSALKSGAPAATIVNTQNGKDRLGSQQEVSSALQGAPDANVVVGVDDESTLGGLDAFKQAGKSASSTCVLGAGGNAEAQAAVKSGKLFADVAFDFQGDLMQNLKELHTMAASPKAAGTQLVTPIQVITK
jgi:ABC-type sugar transport system substrate-binding protein